MKKPTFVLFTGHRNKTADVSGLLHVYNTYPDAIWVHGGAVGFDTQVDLFAKKHGIQRIIVPPPYKDITDKSAPLRRNRLMLHMCDLVVALYDGRTTGGTLYTINYAKKLNKPVLFITLKGVQFLE